MMGTIDIDSKFLNSQEKEEISRILFEIKQEIREVNSHITNCYINDMGTLVVNVWGEYRSRKFHGVVLNCPNNKFFENEYKERYSEDTDEMDFDF